MSCVVATTPRDEASPTFDPRLTCVECGYALRGLNPADACPECGLAIYLRTGRILRDLEPAKALA